MAVLSSDVPHGLQESTPAAALLRALRKHWPVTLALATLTTGIGVIYSRAATKIYEATSLVQIDPRVAQPLGDKGDDILESLGAGMLWDTRDYYETQYKLIVSDRVLGMAARSAGVTTDRDLFPDKPKDAPITLDDAISVLRRRVVADPQKGSRLVLIKVDDTNAARAKRLCDAVANAYVQQNLNVAIDDTSEAVVWLNGQLDHIKQDLETSEDALYNFKRDNDLPSTSINEAANMLRVEMQELDTALTHTRTRRQELMARNAELSRVSPDNPDELPSSEFLTSNYLGTLRREYELALQDYRVLLGDGKGEGHPAVKGAAEKVRTSRDALLAEVRNIQGAVARDLAVVEREEHGISALYEETRKRAVMLNMKEIEFHRLDRWRDQNEKLYQTLLQRLKESDLARMTKANNIRIVDEAVEPTGPIKPRASVDIALGLLVGLLLGVGLAWLREQLDSSIKTPDDVEQKLTTTFLGLLPELDDEGEGKKSRKRRRAQKSRGTDADVPELIVHNRPLGAVAEAARGIRTNLLFMNPDRPFRKLLITSAAPAEGKTTVATSLAIALAQGGQRVCIMDCDFRRPRLHRIFDRVGDAGITSVLVSEATLDEVIKPTEVDNLWAIPAGPIPPNPADMLHSDRFKRVIAELAERFDRVIIDSPPTCAVSDAAIISTLVDGAIFVIRAFATHKEVCQRGLRVLQDVDARVAGAVLNAVNPRRHEYEYYYRYYYYRSNYTSPPAAENAAAPN